ncbi:MAG TPA: hypothetical protein PLP73_00920 [Candidatus Absconditabacterales bacterium]|nr:hypothetical protein [Candidatus Absconditabacterales bacterium]HRU50150.1 hypothetical protein [Candidatus Absconditabacterales bacterium]
MIRLLGLALACSAIGFILFLAQKSRVVAIVSFSFSFLFIILSMIYSYGYKHDHDKCLDNASKIIRTETLALNFLQKTAINATAWSKCFDLYSYDDITDCVMDNNIVMYGDVEDYLKDMGKVLGFNN